MNPLRRGHNDLSRPLRTRGKRSPAVEQDDQGDHHEPDESEEKLNSNQCGHAARLPRVVSA
jgi:hypothetical protein